MVEWEAGRKTGGPGGVGQQHHAASLSFSHHLLDQQGEVAPFQGSRVTHPSEENPGRAIFLFSIEELGARRRKELLSQAWDEKGKVDRPV